MRQKRSIIFLGVIIQTCFVFGQEWTDNKIIYVDNTTMESANPEKVEIEFKWAKCIELNLGKKETIINGKSYYRLKTNISKTDCTISGKLDYADCNGNITTEPFSKNLDDWMKLNIGNSFDGVKLIKVYDIVMSGCKTTPEKEKNISPNPNNGHTIIINSEQDNTGAMNGFYYFSTINVPTDKGIFQIYTAPLYYDGTSPDFNNLKAAVLLFNDSKLKEAIKTEAEEILERKLKPQGKKPSSEDIEKETEELISKIKKNQEVNIMIWTKTVNINYLAKTEAKSKEQMQEVISTMQATLQGLGIDDPELNRQFQTTAKDYYRYIILEKPTAKDLKFTPGLKGKEVIGIGPRG